MSRNQGFTLIEIIVTITIAAILAAMFVQYMGRGLTGSSRPVSLLSETYAVNQVLEKVNAAYKNELKNDTLDLQTFNNNLSGFNENGVTCSGMFLDYRSGGNLIDSNGDGVYEPQVSTAPPTNFLLVTVNKNGRSLRVLFAD